MELKESFSGIDIDKIIRRGDRDTTRASQVPTELWQVAAFYGKPVSEELELSEEINLSKVKEYLIRKELDDWSKRLDAQLAKQHFIFPFYSQEIFTVKTDAINWIPYFIRKLIKEEKLPKEVLDANSILNDELVKTAVVPLSVVFLEREGEFKSV
jgi:hypothetical protein